MAPEQRQPRYQNRALLDAARDEQCIRCGCQDGSVVAAHYAGPGQLRLGKGMGSKCDDDCVAFLCHACHTHFDQYVKPNDYERAWEFLFLVCLTRRRLRQLGLIQ